jgi:hypothetical protein
MSAALALRGIRARATATAAAAHRKVHPRDFSLASRWLVCAYFLLNHFFANFNFALWYHKLELDSSKAEHGGHQRTSSRQLFRQQRRLQTGAYWARDVFMARCAKYQFT